MIHNTIVASDVQLNDSVLDIYCEMMTTISLVNTHHPTVTEFFIFCDENFQDLFLYDPGVLRQLIEEHLHTPRPAH